MNQKFKSLSTRKEVDLIPYVKQFLVDNKDTSIYVGCDSQNERNTTYALVIVLHNAGKGGHVLYSTEVVPKIADRYTRLWNEVVYSVNLADHLTANGIQKPNNVDVDLNPDPKYKSNQLLRAALGYVEAMGYVPRCKPNAMVATYVADALCK